MADKKYVYELEVKTDNSKKSLNQLEGELKDVNAELGKMSTEQLKSSKEGKDLVKRQKEISGALKDHAEAAGKAGAAGKGAFSGMIEGVKGLFTAFVANPVGIIIIGIVAALKGLYDAFQRSEKGRALLNKGLGALQGVMQFISNAFDALAEVLISVFEDPQQAWTDFTDSLSNGYDFIKKQVTDRISGLFDKFAGSFAVITGKIKKLWNEVFGDEEGVAAANKQIEEGLQQYAEGLKKIEGANEDIKEVIDEVVDAYVDARLEVERLAKINEALLNREDALRIKQADDLVRIANLNKDIANQKLIIADRTKSNEERLAAIAKIEKDVLEKNAINLKNKKEELAILVARNAQGNNLIDDTEKQRVLEAELVDLQTEQAAALREVVGQKGEIINKIVTDELKAVEKVNKASLSAEREKFLNKEISYREYQDRLKVLEGEALQRQLDAFDRLLESDKLTAEKRTEIEASRAAKQDEILDKQVETEKGSLSNKLKELEDAANLETELVEKTGDDTADIAKRKLEIQKKYLEEKLKLIKAEALADGVLTDEEIANIDEVETALNKTLENIKASQEDPETAPKTFGDMLGIDEKGQEAINQGIEQAMELWATVNEQLNEASDRRIERIENDADLELQTTQNLGDAKREAILANQSLTDQERQNLLVQSAVETNNALAKIEAEKTKQIEAEKKKQFKRDKAFNIAQALMDTAGAVVKGLNTKPLLPLGLLMAGIAGAMGAVQVATIASQKYAAGGKLQGPLHAAGGMKLPGIELEGDEFVVNRAATAKYEPVLNAINATGNATGDRSSTGEIIDYDRLAAAMQSKKVYVVSSEITDQQSTDTKIINNVQF